MTPIAAHFVETLEARVEGLGISQLIESPFNPRKTFNQAKLEELAQSVREKGVVEPIVVRAWSKHSDKFEIICGARRYRAAQLAGLTHILAVIRTLTDSQAIEIMAIENGQRDDVAPLEEADGYKQLMLVDKTYTAATIATKIGRTEKYVWDRLRLLELVPEIKELLAGGEIGVEHAEVIAKLKPAEQRSLLKTRAYSGDSGLFESDNALAFEDDPTRTKRRKPVSVRELKQHIAEHVRLDIKHAATAAPLEFGETAKRVEEALEQPGRGKKVIPITFSHYCPDGAKDPSERTYGSTAWKKAVGKDGQPTCEYAVLGVVVAGEQYGKSFHVCINRDKCVTHWKDSVKAKEKAAKQRAAGDTSKATKTEAKAEQKEAAKRRADEAKRAAAVAIWKAEADALWECVLGQLKGVKTLSAAQAVSLLEGGFDRGWGYHVNTKKKLVAALGAKWFTKLPAALLILEADNAFETNDSYEDFIESLKGLGVNLKPLQAIHEKAQATATAPAKKAS